MDSSNSPSLFRTYFFSILLISSIVFGGLFGYYFGPQTTYLKPLGELFLNLIFSTLIPLIFFSVSSAIAQAGLLGMLPRISLAMTMVYILGSLIAATGMLIVVKLFPPAQGVFVSLATPDPTTAPTLLSQLAGIMTVPTFIDLFSHQHILALLLFSTLVGLATATVQKETASPFIHFLGAGERIFMTVFSFVMYYAPIGFFAYFAVTVSELGANLMASYARVAILYSVYALVYFVIAYTGFAYLAGKKTAVTLYWQNILTPSLTALATCSSAASIPANLAATKAMKVPSYIGDTTISLGTLIHKEGSVIGGMMKIAFLFGLFHLDFSGTSTLLAAIGISLLVGTVMGAIPSGGMLGELLILNVYGFPPSALIAIASISIIIDPLATMLNVTGNAACSMLITRMVNGSDWLYKDVT